MQKISDNKQKNGTKQLIRNAVLKAMETTDMDKIKIRDIVSVCGVSRASFYRYYSSVEEVVLEIETSFFDELLHINELALRERNLSPNQEPYQSTYARALLAEKYADQLRVILGPHGDPQYDYKITKILSAYHHDKLHTVMNDVEFQFFIEFLAGGLCRMLRYWITKRPDINAEQFLQIQQKVNHYLALILQSE